MSDFVYEISGKSFQKNRILVIFLLGVYASLMAFLFLDLRNEFMNFVSPALIVISFGLLIITNEIILKLMIAVLLVTSTCFFTQNIYKPLNLVLNNDQIFVESSSYKYSIFFVETNFLRRELTTKEMCAIESAAKNNPKALVQVHTISAKLNKKANRLLEKYSNLRVFDLDSEVAFNNTPMMSWWLNGSFVGSKYTFAHIADAFR